LPYCCRAKTCKEELFLQEVQKKKHVRHMPLYLVMVILLLLAAAIAAGIMATRAKPVDIVPQTTIRSILLLAREPEAIAKITITHKSLPGYTLNCHDGTANVDGNEGFPLNEALIGAMLRNASLIEAEDTLTIIPTGDPALAALGLDPAEITADVQFDDGTATVLLLGGRIAGEPTYYGMIRGDNHLYAFSSDVYESFSHELAELHLIPAFDITADQIHNIMITGTQSVTLSLTNGIWQMTAPLIYPADPIRMEKMLENLAGMRLVGWAEDAAALNLAAYGLQNPRVSLTLRLDDPSPRDNGSTDASLGRSEEKSVELSIGDDAKSGTFYCLYEGQVWIGSYFTMGFLLDTDPAMLALESPFNIPVSQLTRLSVNSGGRTAVYGLSQTERVLPNNDLAADEYGNVLFDLIVEKDGAAVDSGAFAKAYAILAAITSSGRLPAGYAPQGEPKTVITLETSQLFRRIAFYTFDAFFDAVAIDGVFVYYARNDWAEAVIFP
jgi:hypothetical protein